MDFKSKAVSALLWSLWQQFSSKILAFIISIVLARLLQPSQFGLLAMLSVAISISNTLLDSGLTGSLIRTTNPDQRDYSTVFFFNIAGSLILYGLLFIAAPWVAAFYHQQPLINILRVYGLILISNAFFGVQSTLLIKDLKFKKQTNIQLPSTIIGGVLGIVLAYMGMGVWSLVWMTLCNSVLSTVLHWALSPWRPILIFDTTRFKTHFVFGYRMTASNLLDTVFQNFYLIIIGKYFSISQLGFYSRADSLSQFPITNISMAINKAAYPVFAEIANNKAQLKTAYKTLIQQVLFWNAPALVLLAVIARPLITVLLTDKWLPSVSYFQLLCISGVMYPLHSYNLNILKVLNKSAAFLRLEFIKKILFLAGIFGAIRFGIFGLLYFQLAFNFVAYYINSSYSGKLIFYPLKEQIGDVLPTLSLAAGIGAGCYWLQAYYLNPHMPDILKMAFISACYISAYAAGGALLRLSAIKDFNQLILKR